MCALVKLCLAQIDTAGRREELNGGDTRVQECVHKCVQCASCQRVGAAQTGAVVVVRNRRPHLLMEAHRIWSHIQSQPG